MRTSNKIIIGIGITATVVLGTYMAYGYYMAIILPDQEYERAKEMPCEDMKTYIDNNGYGLGAHGVQQRIFWFYENKCGHYQYPLQAYQGGAAVGPTIIDNGRP